MLKLVRLEAMQADSMSQMKVLVGKDLVEFDRLQIVSEYDC